MIRGEGRWPADAGPCRLDQAVAALFDALPSRAAARKACARGEVEVDGAPAESSRLLRGGERLVVLEGTRSAPPVLRLELEVVVEDDALAVVVKPPGLPTSGALPRTLERALPGVLAPSPRADALPWPRVVHRLDAPTSGLVLVAKTASAHAALGRAFEERRVAKRYRALVVGALVGEGRVDAPVDGRDAATRWVALEGTPSVRTGAVTTVDAWPETGRTHQIRRHLAALGHPVLGDALYAVGPVLRSKGLFLHAAALGFPHPDDGRVVEVASAEPAKFRSWRERERRRALRLDAVVDGEAS